MAGPTLGERVTRLEEWHTNHETHCDDRQKAMGREIGELKTSVSGLTKGAWGLVLALLAWTAAQVYDGMKNPPSQTTAVSVTQAAVGK